MSSAETLLDVQAVIEQDMEGFWLLAGDLNDDKRREALIRLITAAMAMGYERGLRHGAQSLAEAVLAR